MTAEVDAANDRWASYGSSTDAATPPPDQREDELTALAREIGSLGKLAAKAPVTRHAAAVADGVLTGLGHLLTQVRSEALLEAEGVPLEADCAAWVAQGRSILGRMRALDLATRLDDDVTYALVRLGFRISRDCYRQSAIQGNQLMLPPSAPTSLLAKVRRCSATFNRS